MGLFFLLLLSFPTSFYLLLSAVGAGGVFGPLNFSLLSIRSVAAQCRGSVIAGLFHCEKLRILYVGA